MRCAESLCDDEQPESLLTSFEKARLERVRERHPWSEFTDSKRQWDELQLVKFRNGRGDFGGDT